MAEQALIDALDAAEGWLWLRCAGPDGLVWLLARYHTRCGRPFIDLPDDARDYVPLEGRTIHKWRIVEVHAAHPPVLHTDLRDALWVAPEVIEEVNRG